MFLGDKKNGFHAARTLSGGYTQKNRRNGSRSDCISVSAVHLETLELVHAVQIGGAPGLPEETQP